MRFVRWLGRRAWMVALARRPWTLALVTWVVLAVPGFIVVQNYQARSDRFVDCVTDWANETAVQTRLLRRTRQDRDDAVSQVLRDAAKGDREALVRDLATYVRVDDAHRELLSANPVPDPPTLRCRR